MRIFWYLMIGGSLLVVLLSGLQATAFMSLLDRHFERGMRDQGVMLGRLMADTLSQQLIQGRSLEMRQTLRDLVDREDWLTYLFVTDFDGRLAAHSFPQGFPRALLPRLTDVGGKELVRLRGEQAYVYDLAVPLIQGLPAYLHVGIDEQPLIRLTDDLLYQIARVSLLVLAASILLWRLMARRIADPLQAMARRLEDYRRGRVRSVGRPVDSPLREIRSLDQRLRETIEERQRLERRLRERETHLRLLVEHSPVGLVLSDEQGRPVEVNQAYADITGRSIREVADKNPWQLAPDEEALREREQMALLESSGRYGPYETELLHRDGHRVPVRMAGLIVQQDGERYIWSSVEDISDRHEAERLAVMFDYLLRHSEEEIYLLDPQSLSILQASRGASERLGYGIEELKRMTPMDFNPEQTRERTRAVLASIGEQGGQRVFEAVHCRRNGECFPVEVRLQMLGEGRERVLFVSAFDRTAIKQAEEAAEAERYKLERLVEERTASIRLQSRIIEQTSDAIVSCDLQGLITGWYGGAARYFGYDAGQAIGRHLRQLFPEAEAYGFHARYILPVLKQGHLELESTLRHADGHPLPTQLQFSLLKNEQGAPVGLIMTSIDISAIRRREQELQALTRRLEIVNQELESFSYSVSHDLRAPLRAIDGFSQALIEDYGERLDDDGRQYLQRVRAGAQRMAELIDDLLNLSRVNRSEMTPGWVDLSALAGEVIQELRHNDPQRDVTVEIASELKVWADPRLMRVLLHNLLGNAWKFTARTEQAWIRLRSSEEPPFSFCVEDNGVGFDMRHADKLFGAFQRLHRASDFPGTGIGLATVKRIINRHGGDIQVRAEPGRGACFCVTLPGPSPEEEEQD